MHILLYLFDLLFYVREGLNINNVILNTIEILVMHNVSFFLSIKYYILSVLYLNCIFKKKLNEVLFVGIFQ